MTIEPDQPVPPEPAEPAPADDPAGSSRTDDATEPTARDEPAEPAPTGERPVGPWIAGVHLRTGSLALARAELESFAGRGLLDDRALVDLAEARWRTGDLSGGGEAAQAAIGRGVGEPLAFVIAAEAVFALGRPAEARRLAVRARGDGGRSIDALFAGMPRSPIWPLDEAPELAPAPGSSIDPDDGSRSVAAGFAADTFAGGCGALAAGDIVTASVALGLTMRLDPAFAQVVLDAVRDRLDESTLTIVAGDALRLLGREAEARLTFESVRDQLRETASPESGSDPESGAAAEPGAAEEAETDRGD